jgi:hypothetical protein
LEAFNIDNPVLSTLAVHAEYIFLSTLSEEQATTTDTHEDCTASAYPFINVFLYTNNIVRSVDALRTSNNSVIQK